VPTSAAEGACCAVQGPSAPGFLFDDEEGDVSCPFGDDNDRPLLHGQIAFIAGDEPAPLSLGSPRSGLEVTQDE
jgi:hypothetical protein